MIASVRDRRTRRPPSRPLLSQITPLTERTEYAESLL